MINRKKQFTADDISYLQQINQPIASLEEPVSRYADTGDEVLRQDIIKDPAPSPFEISCLLDNEETVKELLETLKPSEIKVIRLRYGLDDGTPLTLDEIGDRYNISRQRVSQIELSALNRMRKYLRCTKQIDNGEDYYE